MQNPSNSVLLAKQDDVRSAESCTSIDDRASIAFFLSVIVSACKDFFKKKRRIAFATLFPLLWLQKAMLLFTNRYSIINRIFLVYLKWGFCGF